VLAAPLGAEAQQAGNPRIGYLGVASARANRGLLDAFQQGLREHGYEEGRNLVLERRFADGHMDRVPILAKELVRLNVDVIFAGSPEAARAAKDATNTIPIVVAAGDPTRTGLATSLSRPGGNVTGLASVPAELSGKRLEIMKATSGASRVAVLVNPTNTSYGLVIKAYETAASTLSVAIQFAPFRERGDFDIAFQAAMREKAAAVIVMDDSVTFNALERIAALAAQSRLPTMCGFREFTMTGGLMALGPNLADNWRRAAAYVDKILKGAKPADLPIEQPTTFELVINLKTAKALGLTIPPSLLLRADQVIE